MQTMGNMLASGLWLAWVPASVGVYKRIRTLFPIFFRSRSACYPSYPNAQIPQLAGVWLA